MTAEYEVIALTDEDLQRLQRVYDDLQALASCPVPSVRGACRTAVAFVAQALNGQGLTYDLYTNRWDD